MIDQFYTLNRWQLIQLWRLGEEFIDIAELTVRCAPRCLELLWVHLVTSDHCLVEIALLLLASSKVQRSIFELHEIGVCSHQLTPKISVGHDHIDTWIKCFCQVIVEILDLCKILISASVLNEKVLQDTGGHDDWQFDSLLQRCDNRFIIFTHLHQICHLLPQFQVSLDHHLLSEDFLQQVKGWLV